MIRIIQIGQQNWADEVALSSSLVWEYCRPDELRAFVANVEPDTLFQALVVTDSVREELLESLDHWIEAHALLLAPGVQVLEQAPRGFAKRKMPQQLPAGKTVQEMVLFLEQTLFPSQYGAKLKIPDMDLHPDFQGEVTYDGHVSVHFQGEFGQEFSPLFTFRYNLSNFPQALEIWQEYQKKGDCQIALEITRFYRGSIYGIAGRRRVTEEEMQTPFLLDDDVDEIGYYSIEVLAKGKGILEFGPLHWRYSRQGLGQFVLGGQRFADHKRQEVITYFHPQDLKPPLTVYFAGFRPAEGFEGYGMMKNMGTPFLLIGDPRLEGGSFYAGSEELEAHIEKNIQTALDYLGFDSSQLILSGLSMGTFGALYYASSFDPAVVIVGKPFVHIGDSAQALKLKRPDEFETSADVVNNLVQGTDEAALQRVNQKFWKKFEQSSFAQTRFAIAYMEEDDYDSSAMQALRTHLAPHNVHIYGKGYAGRHNDNSPAINKWFKQQYAHLLREGFGRGEKK